jgi:integrase
MLLQGTGVAVAQRQLRHSDASTTLGHWGHILGNDHRDAVETIEGVLSGPQS